jgi:hypothetical protein
VRGHITPSHHGVIAKTEFSTWEFLLDDEFMGRGLIWPKHLSAVFRGPWPVRQTSALLLHIRRMVMTLREFRNRIFHHEPAWKRYGVLTEADALQHLKEKISKAEDLLALIYPENLRMLEVNRFVPDAHRACTADEIRRFQHLAQTHKINSLGKLAQLVDRSNTENSVLEAKVFRGRKQRFLIQPQ